MKTKTIVRLTTLGVLAGATALGAYVLTVRPWFLRWGATDPEVNATLPGDELLPYPKHHDTHAITIHAPIAVVWPWLVQIGQGRGGFYSYTLLENLVGCHMHNADHILAEYQTLQAGDPVLLHPQAPPLTAVVVHPEQELVLAGKVNADTGTPAYNGTWGFYVRAVNSNTTRLLIRNRGDWKSSPLAWIGYRWLLEPVHFIMERKMMLHIKALAEGAA